MVVWLIGLSGSGKTTIGTKLSSRLKISNPSLVYLDGDILRDIWCDDLGHDIESRRINAERISKLCKELDRQGIFVIASVLSIFPEWQLWNRDNFSRYFQVFLDVPFETLVKRDTKGLYRQALNKELSNVAGVDIVFPEPQKSDHVISNWPRNYSPDDAVEEILLKLEASS